MTGFGRTTNMVKAEQGNAEDCHLLPLTVHRFFCPLAVIIQETVFLYSDLSVSLSGCTFNFQHLFSLLPLCFQVRPVCQGIVTEG